MVCFLRDAAGKRKASSEAPKNNDDGYLLALVNCMDRVHGHWHLMFMIPPLLTVTDIPWPDSKTGVWQLPKHVLSLL